MKAVIVKCSFSNYFSYEGCGKIYRRMLATGKVNYVILPVSKWG